MVTPLEAMADAIEHHEGWYPGSVANRNRNPGNLRRGPRMLHVDAGGYAVYSTRVAGLLDLLDDLRGKCDGHNTHGLGPASTLDQLFEVYAPRGDHNEPHPYAVKVAAWMAAATGIEFRSTSELVLVFPGRE